MGAVVVPWTPASATPTTATVADAGVPPSALGDCNGAERASGGWSIRDVLSEGTSIPDPAPVRPRSARLFEPCFDSNGFSDAPLAIAALLTDIPVDILDEDGDGTDDGAPPQTCDEYQSDWLTYGAPEIIALNRVCDGKIWSARGNTPNLYHPESHVTTTAVLSTSNTRNVDYTITGMHTSSVPQSFAFALLCQTPAGVIDGTVATTAIINWSSTLPASSGTMQCPTSKIPYKVFLSSRAGTPLGSGNRVGGLVYSRPAGSDTGAGGTAYYGGTQGAHYTFGADTSFGGVTDNGSIVCSANYDGSAPVTHALKNTPHGSWTNIDRSEEPPVLVDGVASEWSAKVLYYPTNTLTGGVYASNCKFLVSVTIWICSYAAHSPMEYGCIQMVWDAERYRSQQPYFGTDAESPETAICTIFPNTPGCYEVLNPEALEAPIVCLIEAEGEFFTWIITWIGNLPGWVGCMFTPEGWDRSGKMTRTWELGAAGQMQQAFYDSMPSGIGCGMIGQIPFEGQVLTINTCDADFAPGWVKIALGWILVLGLGALAIKRILWSIGGNK